MDPKSSVRQRDHFPKKLRLIQSRRNVLPTLVSSCLKQWAVASCQSLFKKYVLNLVRLKNLGRQQDLVWKTINCKYAGSSAVNDMYNRDFVKLAHTSLIDFNSTNYSCNSTRPARSSESEALYSVLPAQ